MGLFARIVEFLGIVRIMKYHTFLINRSHPYAQPIKVNHSCIEIEPETISEQTNQI